MLFFYAIMHGMMHVTYITCPFCSFTECIRLDSIPFDWFFSVICSKCFGEYRFFRDDSGEILTTIEECNDARDER